MQQIFETSNPPSIVEKLKFFLTKNGKLYLITAKDFFAESEEIRDFILAGDTNPNKQSNFSNTTTASDLKRAFKELALTNPTDFRTLYYTLKEHDEKIFPIILSALEEVQDLFNFC